MKTTKKVVSDGREEERKWAMLRGFLAIRFDGIIDRIKKGSLDYGIVMCELQAIAEKRVKILEHPETDQEMSNIPNLEWWRKFYLENFNMKLNFLRLDIPPKPAKDNWRLLVIVKGLTNNLVYDVCAKQFPCCKYADDLDKGVSTNERDPKNGSYAIWVRDTVEADEVHRNKSADIVKEAGLKTETLLERMIHELAYFSGTGEHLDVKNWTLCSGSRCSGGDVPNADWDDDEFRVNWNDTGNRVGCLRAREVVS